MQNWLYTVQLKVAKNHSADLARALKVLTENDVLVGVPESNAPRKRDASPRKRDGKQIMNNATLAYIHDNGSLLAHIPPRPFMKPGIENAKADITKFFEQAGKAAFAGKPNDIDRALNAAGLTAQKSIRRKIQTGPFTPLKASTIAARKRRHKRRANTSVTPLIDTGQMALSISYQVVKKS